MVLKTTKNLVVIAIAGLFSAHAQALTTTVDIPTEASIRSIVKQCGSKEFAKQFVAVQKQYNAFVFQLHDIKNGERMIQETMKLVDHSTMNKADCDHWMRQIKALHQHRSDAMNTLKKSATQ